MIFDCLTVNLDFGPAGMRPVQLMPRLVISVYEKEEYKQMGFVRTRLYTGDIEIGGEPYEARLGNDYAICRAPRYPGHGLDAEPQRPSRQHGAGGGAETV